MNPARQIVITQNLLSLNPLVSKVNSGIGWERCWSIAMELMRYINDQDRALEQIATTPTLDMPPAQLAVITGIKEMARKARNGE